MFEKVVCYWKDLLIMSSCVPVGKSSLSRVAVIGTWKMVSSWSLSGQA